MRVLYGCYEEECWWDYDKVCKYCMAEFGFLGISTVVIIFVVRIFFTSFIDRVFYLIFK